MKSPPAVTCRNAKKAYLSQPKIIPQVNRIISFVKRRKYTLTLIVVLLLLYAAWLPKKLFTDTYSTVVYDAHNELLGAHIAKDGQWRFPYSDSIPDKFKTCITYFEDEYFYRHLGVNPFSLSKAFIKNSKSGKVKSGGVPSPCS